MSLRIVSVAYPLAPVSSDTAGGAEQVLWMLDEALVRAGHDSIVVAAECSKVAGRLITSGPVPDTIDDETKAGVRKRHAATVQSAIDEHRPHLLHFHGVDFHHYLPQTTVPILVTLHLPFEYYEPAAFEADVLFNCVSEAQYRSKPADLDAIGWIENGVPVLQLATHATKRDFAFSMGRICEEKALHIAMDAAARAQTFLVFGGGLFGYAEHKKYFESMIQPRLNSERNRFLGQLSFERKRRYLTAASCFLQPSQAPETSSLTAMESLACGTPVISFANGALPHIVEAGRTGFIVPDQKSMAEAIRDAKVLDPEDCRRAARERFSSDTMTSAYLSVYHKLAGGRSIPRPRPSLEQRWRDLWHNQPHSTPFQSPDWLLSWIEHLGGSSCELKTFFSGGELVGLLPLNEWEGRKRLLGEGVTDYLDAIGQVEFPASPFEFTGIPEWSQLRRHPETSSDVPCLVASLPKSWDKYMMSLPQKLRKDLRHAQGEVRQLRAKEIGELFRLHACRWREQRQNGVLADPRVQAFHRDVARRFERQGILRLLGLFLDSKCIAVVYGFQWRQRFYLYLGGFDPAYAEISPGSVAIGAAIERAIQEGVTAIDFLRGSEPYKHRWGAREVPTYRITA